MRADRLLSLLMLLQIRGSITARELAERLEVSERTIYRDIEALSLSGVPVYAERGPSGGCRLAEGYRTNLTGLTEDEVRTLFLSGVARPLADLGAGKALEAALLKLLAALPSVQRRDIEYTRQRLYMDAVGWFYSHEVSPFLHTLRQAIWDDRKVCLTYRKPDGVVSERIVEPLGLVAKAGVWYMVALSHSELRVFRVSRVCDALITNESFQRPEDFDLEQYWITWTTDFQTSVPTYAVTIRVSPAFVPVLPQILGESIHKLIEAAPPPDKDGWITITLQFDSFEHARRHILGLGTFVEVVEPLELRQAVIQVASGIVEFYKERDNL
ncbi:MAG TPA: YafY family protein [Ktedonosporobacter sp.]|nr:YafY family protein [Ktedonosporobacter sp.]